uniref:tetratricopeptide repeat protein n=1 Tax=Roseivirga sp. TaxID=1964215 RepID=UPI004047FF18
MKSTLLILSILSCYSVLGQKTNRTPDEVAFDKAFEMYYDEEYDSALLMYEEFMRDYPASPLIPRAKYNTAYILRELERDIESIPIFEEILISNYNDNERFGGLMEEYALYKHRSASHLADIYLGSEDYDKAAKYIKLFDKKYKYKHFCGNEMMANEIYTAISYAKLYNGQGKSKKAINKLLPYIFDNGLTSNLLLLDVLNGFIEEQYSDESMQMLVKQARSSLIIKDQDTAFIKFLGEKIEVYDYQLFSLHNLEYQENLKLVGIEKWFKVFDTNPIFQKYMK